jgi:DNA-binding CsgD family transcriptional regulator
VGWFLRGFLGVLQSDPANARPALRRAADAAARTDQPTLRVQSLAMASIAANTAGDRAAARELLAAATASGTGARAGTAVGAEAAAAVGDYPAAISVLQARALDALFVGDAGAARAAGTVGAGLARAAGDLYSLGMMLSNVGLAELMAGELERCAAPCVEALRLARRLDDRVAQYCLLDALGCHAAGTGRPALAARLLGAAQAALDAAGARPLPYFEPLVDAATRAATGALGAERFRRGFAAGRALDRADAIALALGEPAGPPPAAPAGPAPLRERETQVAGLVAEGLSNRQIAARLLISEHTVDSHVRNILTKLGVGSRAQIAAWLATNRPAGP